MGIFDAVDLPAARKIFDEVVTWAKVVCVYEVDPAEVARVRTWQVQPKQLSLPGL